MKNAKFCREMAVENSTSGTVRRCSVARHILLKWRGIWSRTHAGAASPTSARPKAEHVA